MNLGQPDREELKVIDVEYSVESGHKIAQPIVHLYCRNGAGDMRTIDVEGFRPYFYMAYDEFCETTSDVINDRHVLAVEANLCFAELDADGNLQPGACENPETLASELTAAGNETTVYHNPDTFDALDDTRLVKVYTVEPAHVGKIRDHWDQTWEADIPFTRRFMISSDIYLGCSVPTGAERVRYENWPGHSDTDALVQAIQPCDAPDIAPRMMVCDIEVRTNGGGVPDPADANNAITAITAYDNYTGDYAGWILESEQWDDVPDSETFEADVDAELGIELDTMEVFDHETQMVEDFHQWVLARDFDMVSGWNSDSFDYPYIIQRSYNISAYSIRDWDDADTPYNMGDEWPDPHIEGLVLFDMLDAYKKTQYRELESYSLGAVAEAELGIGKIELEESLDDAWHKHPIEFLRYNVRDVEAVVDIEANSGLIDLYDNMRDVTGALYNTCNHNGPMLDTLFCRKAYEEGIALPTNTEVPPEEGNYHGAKVFDVTPGKHKNAIYPDLSSMYPNLFAMLNLGSETIIGSQTELDASEYTSNDVYRVPIDNRDFKVVPKGESYESVDRDKYKGVIKEDGGVREMFDPVYQDMYVLKPEIKESFLTSTIDDLIELKNKYSGTAYSAIKRVTNCHTPDTNVLTTDGLCPISEVSVGDEVYSLDTDTMELSESTVTNTFENQYSGELVEISNRYINASVTPGHEFVTNTQSRDTFEKTSAEEIASKSVAHFLPNGWDVEENSGVGSVFIPDYLDCTLHFEHDVKGHTFRKIVGDGPEYEGSERASYKIDSEIYREHEAELSGIGNVLCSNGTEYARIPGRIDATDFMKLMGWYIAEGRCRVNNTGSSGIVITQCDDSGRDKICELVEDIGFDYYSVSTEKDVNITSDVLAQFFEKYCGDGSKEKKIPQFVFDQANKSELSVLFETMMGGDGHRSSSSEYYATSSEELAKDFAHLCVILGKTPQIREVKHDEYDNSYRVTWKTTRSTIRGEMCENVNYEGRVYDIEVSGDHTYVFERNGMYNICHNSVYGIAGDSTSAGKGFRLFDRRVAEGITLAGRKTIEHTADEFTGYLQDNFDPETTLVAGDTDSCVSSIPNADTFEQVYSWSKEACEYVDQSYDDFVQEEFEMGDDADKHRLHVELESVASGLFFIEDFDADQPEPVGVKKRYAQHIIWDDDDGWLDLPDADETEYDVLADPDDRSELKQSDTVSLEDYKEGVLSDTTPSDHIGIKGFEYVRSDTAQVTKEAQLAVLTDILLTAAPADRIYDDLNEIVDAVRSDDFDVSRLGRHKGISNPLDDYGWKTVDELANDSNYTVRDEDEEHGGRYVSTPSPTYRGAKYADDHFDWEQIGAGSKPMRFYVEKVRGNEYPQAYRYDSYPKDSKRPDPPEVKRPVDAIAVDNPDRIPDAFVLDIDKMVTKELEDKLQPILRTIGEDWDGMVGNGRQSGLDAFM